MILAQTIEKRLRGLSRHPYLGRIPDDEELMRLGYRFLVVKNYLIFTTVEFRSILVHRIVHGARNYLPLLSDSSPFLN